METKNLIQASAKIIKITELKKGSLVKVIKKEYSSNEMHYGIVTDLLNSGNKTWIEMILFKKSYSDIKGEVQLFEGSDNLEIFPAKIDEIKVHLDDALESMEKSVGNKKEEIRKAEEALARAKSFVSGQMGMSLIETPYEVIEEPKSIEASST